MIFFNHVFFEKSSKNSYPVLLWSNTDWWVVQGIKFLSIKLLFCYSLSFFFHFFIAQFYKKNINYDFSVKRWKDFRKFLNVFTHDSRCTEICSFFPYVMDRTSTRLRCDTDRVITASCCPRISLFYFMLIKYF